MPGRDADTILFEVGWGSEGTVCRVLMSPTSLSWACRKPSAQVLQVAFPKCSGNASPDRSKDALEKASSCERHTELNH